MLKDNQLITAKWHARNKSHFESLGYQYTKMGDEFEIKAEDLMPMSKFKVIVICDYCGKEVIKKYNDYVRQHDDEFGDACRCCQHLKSKQMCLKKYGVPNVSQVPEIQAKREQYFIDTYGVANPFQYEEFKDKIKATNLDKYGFEYVAQVPEIKAKQIATLQERYGVINPGQIPEVKEKVKNTCMEHYGVPYSLQAPEIRRQIMQTLYENGKVPTFTQQLQVYDMLKDIYDECELNYPCGRCSLDCMININDARVDIEYDGWYWHKDKEDYDKRRDIFVKSQGYKILRIKGNYAVPSKEQLIEAIDYLVKGGHSYTEMFLDI